MSVDIYLSSSHKLLHCVSVSQNIRMVTLIAWKVTFKSRNLGQNNHEIIKKIYPKVSKISKKNKHYQKILIVTISKWPFWYVLKHTVNVQRRLIYFFLVWQWYLLLLLLMHLFHVSYHLTYLTYYTYMSYNIRERNME